MDLVDRYLQSVRFWLPNEQKEDIVAELAGDMQDETDEQEAALGRKLNEAEIVAMLKLRGNPFVVANRFLPPRSFIGPLLLPMYWFVLKIVALCYVIVWMAISFAPLLGVKMPITVQVEPIFISFAVVTIVFAAIEKWHVRSDSLGEWNPRKLPPLRNSNHISRTGSSIEFVVNLVVLVWFVSNASTRIVQVSSGVQMRMADVWVSFFWGYLVLLISNLALSCLNLMRPSWSVSRAVYRLISDAAGAALFCWLCAADVISEMVIANVSSARSAEILNSFNWCAGKVFPWAVLVGLVAAGFNIYRIVRLKTKRRPVPQAVVA